MKQEFQSRSEKVKIDSLSEFFDDDPVFEIRGLSGSEVALSNEAVARNKNVSALTEALVSDNKSEKVQALKKLIGNSDDVPADLAKRMEMLVSGCISPTVDIPFTIKLAEYFPVDFMNLTNKIMVLTGQGAEMVKQKPSGKVQK